MHEALKKIANNPQALSTREVLKLLESRAIREDELASVVGKKMVGELKGSQEWLRTAEWIGDLSFDHQEAPGNDFTQIIFWGKQGSGKSAAIAALFKACQEYNTKVINNSYIELEVKGTFGKEVYPLGFVEVDMSDADYYQKAQALLKSRNQKVHFFCIDGSLPKEMRKEQDAQAAAFEKLLGQLESDGVLGRSNGIYILVTKTDALLRVPKNYREGAAQTKITADQSRLWRKVLNVDYAQNIYDSTPIAFSIGEVMFQDFIKPDLTDARKLLRKPILEKCDSRRNWLGRLLNKGNGFVSALLLLMVIGIIGAMGYLFFDMLPSAPKDSVATFDYVKYFKTEEKAVATSNYSDAVKTYDKLRTDLDVEHKIKCLNDTATEEIPLLDQKDFEELNTLLTKDYAEKLIERYKDIFYRNWAQGSERSKTNEVWRRSQALVNSGNTSLRSTFRNTLVEYNGYVSTYDQKIAPLIRMSNNCQSLANAHKVENEIGNYKKWPYNNDYNLASSINHAADNAYKSYAEYLRTRAQGWRNSFENECSRTYFFQWFRRSELENRYRGYTQSLLEEINTALYDMNGKHSEAVSILESARNRISF